MNHVTPNQATKLITDLKARRESLGISQQKLADLCHISRYGLYNIESGNYFPNLELFTRMAHHLGATIALS